MVRLSLRFLMMGLLVTIVAMTVGCGKHSETDHGSLADLVFVIPPGTFEAERQGDPAFTFPATIALATGQAITVHNQDEAVHTFLYTPILPGQSFRKVFSEPGSYGYSGVVSCSIGRGTSITIEVGGPDD